MVLFLSWGALEEVFKLHQEEFKKACFCSENFFEAWAKINWLSVYWFKIPKLEYIEKMGVTVHDLRTIMKFWIVRSVSRDEGRELAIEHGFFNPQYF